MDEHPSESPRESASEATATTEPGETATARDEGVASTESGAPDPVPPVPDAASVSQPSKAPENAPDVKGKPRRKWRRDPSVVRAYRAGIPVDGLVEKVIKGGYEVRVGKSRGFCPHSQMDLHRIENPEEFVGKKHTFRISEMRRGGEELILSRRTLLEEMRGEEAKAVRATLLEGALTRGRVARVTEFGAFVDLGAGVTGLVHLTELSHSRVKHPEEVVHVGDSVSVKILKLDEAQGRISLSIRQTEADPWESAKATLKVGQAVRGTVARFADFGAFIEVLPGVEALASARDFPPTAGGWRKELEAGQARDWVIASFEPARHRISVVPVYEGSGAPGRAPLENGARVKGRVQRVERFGVFVWLGPGQVGLVPTAWTGVPRAANLERKFATGSEIEVEVVERSEDGRRIRLAVEGVPRPAPDEGKRPERAPRPGRAGAPTASDREAKEKTPAGSPASTSFGTSLGDALRAAFVKKGAER